MNFTNLNFSYHRHASHPKMVNKWSCSFQEEVFKKNVQLLTDARGRTTTDKESKTNCNWLPG